MIERLVPGTTQQAAAMQRQGERIRSIGAVAIMVLAMLPRAAFATEQVFYEVSQPFFQPNGGLEIHRVTYLAWVGSPQPGAEIRYLSSPNCTLRHDGHPVEPDSVWKDQNVASRLGVRLAVEDRSDSRTWRQFSARPETQDRGSKGSFGVDILGVDVDLSRTVKALAEERGRSDFGDMVTIGRLADVLIACIRENASRSQPRIRFVRIRFQGASEAAKHDGVYQVAR